MTAKNKRRKVITLCSSASFFRDVLGVEKELKTLGFEVKIPYTAVKMRKTGDYRVTTYKTWFNDPKKYNRKTWLTKNHFAKVKTGDAVLVVNKSKNGIDGYIGGATFGEMVIAFDYKKPIYLLNPISTKLPFFEEVMAMQPIFLNGDITKIKRLS